jgi:hypothetical protein
MGRDWQFCQCNRSLMDHSSWAYCSLWAATLGTLTCGEGGNLSTRDLGFIYVSAAGRVGCEFMHPAETTDAPSIRRSSRSHLYTRGSRGVDPFLRTSASRTEKPGAYSNPGTPSMRGLIIHVLIRHAK